MPPAQETAPTGDRPIDLGPTLIAETMRKAGLVWISYDAGGTAPRPAWHVWVDGAAYLVTGGAEQLLPGLTEATEVTVVVPSKDTRARVVTWIGRVVVVDPGSATWATATPALAAGRLNAEGGAAMIDRWSRESAIVQIVPTGQVVESAEDPSEESLAQRPLKTPATTLGRQPRMVGGIPRRRR